MCKTPNTANIACHLEENILHSPFFLAVRRPPSRITITAKSNLYLELIKDTAAKFANKYWPGSIRFAAGKTNKDSPQLFTR